VGVSGEEGFGDKVEGGKGSRTVVEDEDVGMGKEVGPGGGPVSGWEGEEALTPG